MKKFFCLALSTFMLVNLSFAVTLPFKPVKTKVNLKINKIVKVEIEDKVIKLQPGMRIGDEEPIPVPTPIKPVEEIM